MEGNEKKNVDSLIHPHAWIQCICILLCRTRERASERNSLMRMFIGFWCVGRVHERKCKKIAVIGNYVHHVVAKCCVCVAHTVYANGIDVFSHTLCCMIVRCWTSAFVQIACACTTFCRLHILRFKILSNQFFCCCCILQWFFQQNNSICSGTKREKERKKSDVLHSHWNHNFLSLSSRQNNNIVFFVFCFDWIARKPCYSHTNECNDSMTGELNACNYVLKIIGKERKTIVKDDEKDEQKKIHI